MIKKRYIFLLVILAVFFLGAFWSGRQSIRPPAATISPIKPVETQQKKPEQVSEFYIPAPTAHAAAEMVAEEIERGNPALPAAALEKTDKTVIVPDEAEQKVDVYKVNLEKQHRVKAGVTVIENKAYGTVAYEAGQWEAQIHADAKGVQGGTVLYTVKKW